jgi:hypothetical protein
LTKLVYKSVFLGEYPVMGIGSTQVQHAVGSANRFLELVVVKCWVYDWELVFFSYQIMDKLR